TETQDGFTYEIDWDVLENAITPETRMFLFCNPHNPVGRVWTRDELERIAALCVKHDLIMCSDEIHSDLLMSGYEHVPIAALPGMAERTVTLIAPSKTFNIAGLSFSVAIIQDKTLRDRFVNAGTGTVFMTHGEMVMPFMNMTGHIAAYAAYQHGDPWLEAALTYMEGNRDFLHEYVAEKLPDVKLASLEGTYLQWMDFRAYDLPELPGKWLAENAKVAFNEGAMFGEEGAGFVRMNLATQRDTIREAVDRIHEALAAR
ncbi:MAG: aminotransferase class I/II-fold pyridoxal phosphate-dependent enzyme, partial [Chloroflexota bacterium]